MYTTRPVRYSWCLRASLGFLSGTEQALLCKRNSVTSHEILGFVQGGDLRNRGARIIISLLPLGLSARDWPMSFQGYVGRPTAPPLPRPRPPNGRGTTRIRTFAPREIHHSAPIIQLPHAHPAPPTLTGPTTLSRRQHNCRSRPAQHALNSRGHPPIPRLGTPSNLATRPTLPNRPPWA